MLKIVCAAKSKLAAAKLQMYSTFRLEQKRPAGSAHMSAHAFARYAALEPGPGPVARGRCLELPSSTPSPVTVRSHLQLRVKQDVNHQGNSNRMQPQKELQTTVVTTEGAAVRSGIQILRSLMRRPDCAEIDCARPFTLARFSKIGLHQAHIV